MEPPLSPTGAGRIGCFGGIFHFNHKRKAKTAATTTQEKRKSIAGESDQQDNKPKMEATNVSVVPEPLISITSGALATFALCDTEGNSRSRSGSEKLFLRPYFGRFAGRWMTFDLRKKERLLTSIKVRVEGYDMNPLASFYHSARKNESTDSLRDRCIRFSQDLVPVRGASDHEIRAPQSLSFLCEKAVILHHRDLPVSSLPTKLRSKFSEATMDVVVRVWPKSASASPICLRVKPNIQVRELQWMLCERLSLSSPRFMSIYKQNSLESLHPSHPLQPSQTNLECTLLPQAFQSREEVARSATPVAVSLIGHGVDEVKVNPTMTLYEFEQAVRKKFQLRPNSFLYLPQAFKCRHSYQSGLKMAAPLESSSIMLIGRERRCPVIDGIPSLEVTQTYEQLPLYQMTISELDLLKASPIIAFDVAGPTIPIAFKTVQTQGPGEDLSSFNPRNEIFALVSVKQHAVSINPYWTMDTLMKYIECISGFPCEHVRYKSTVFDKNSSVGVHLCKQWCVTTSSGYVTLPKEIPEVTPL